MAQYGHSGTPDTETLVIAIPAAQQKHSTVCFNLIHAFCSRAMKNALHWIAFIWFNVLSLVIDLKPLVFNSNLFISLWRSSHNYMSIPIFYQCILLMNKFCLHLPPMIWASPMLLCNPQHVLIVAIRRAIDYFDINEWCLFDGESFHRHCGASTLPIHSITLPPAISILSVKSSEHI